MRGIEGPNCFKYVIKNRYKHPNYKGSSIDDDIALFELSENVQFNSYVVPICLPYFDEKPDKAIATGYGSTGYIRGLTDKLMKVRLNIFKEIECQDRFPVGEQIKDPISYDSKVCAGSFTQGKDTCKIDIKYL